MASGYCRYQPVAPELSGAGLGEILPTPLSIAGKQRLIDPANFAGYDVFALTTDSHRVCNPPVASERNAHAPAPKADCLMGPNSCAGGGG